MRMSTPTGVHLIDALHGREIVRWPKYSWLELRWCVEWYLGHRDFRRVVRYFLRLLGEAKSSS